MLGSLRREWLDFVIPLTALSDALWEGRAVAVPLVQARRPSPRTEQRERMGSQNCALL
jgi:hypothetical protein